MQSARSSSPQNSLKCWIKSEEDACGSRKQSKMTNVTLLLPGIWCVNLKAKAALESSTYVCRMKLCSSNFYTNSTIRWTSPGFTWLGILTTRRRYLTLLTQLDPFGGGISSNSPQSLGESQALTLFVAPPLYFGKISGLVRSCMTHTHVLSLTLCMKTYRSRTSWGSCLCMKHSTSRCHLKRMMRSDNYKRLRPSSIHQRQPRMCGITCGAKQTSSPLTTIAFSSRI